MPQHEENHNLIAKEGWPLIAIFVVGAIVLGYIHPLLGVVGGGLLVWCVWFFRDPARAIPEGEGLLVSPCDGKVIAIHETAMPGSGEKAKVISIFMNVFDVHVVRSPVEGSVIESEYTPGKFVNAALDKASLENENHLYTLETHGGQHVAFRLIAGLVARRIVTKFAVGDTFTKGGRAGVIRFGSRVDVFVPENTKIDAYLGQTMVSGESVLGQLKAATKEKAKPAAKAKAKK